MLSHKAKDAFYSAAGPLMKINGIIYRYLRTPRTGLIKVQLGPGQNNYLASWINLDATKSKRIIEQINRCPSGALKYKLNSDKKASA